MSYITKTLTLGIVLLTIVSVDKVCCNRINELQYAFRYDVDAANLVTQHWEERSSDIVHGSYSFLEPTGRVRVVQYQVNGGEGFKAVVTFRKPPGYPLLGHLKFPINYQHPVVLAKPVAYITADLFKRRKTYPNLPD